MPQNEIVSLACDKNQFIWLGTQNGIARFDGNRFLTFSRTSLPFLGSNRVLNVIREKENLLFRTDADWQKWYRVSDNSADIEHLPLKDGNKWIAGAGQRVDLEKVFEGFSFDKNKELQQNLDDNNLGYFKIITGSLPGNYFIYSANKIYYSGGTGANNVCTFDYDLLNHTFAIDGKFYFIDKNGIVNGYTKEGVKLPKVNITGIEQLNTLSVNNSFYVVQTSTSEIYFHKDNFLYKIQSLNNKLECKRILELPNGVYLNCLYHELKNDIMLLGTHNDGLMIYYPRQFSCFKQSMEKDQLSMHLNVFYAVSTTSDNRILTTSGFFDTLGNFTNKELTSVQFWFRKMGNGKYYYIQSNKLIETDENLKGHAILDRNLFGFGGMTGDDSGNLYWISSGQLNVRTSEGKISRFQIPVEKNARIFYSLEYVNSGILWFSNGKKLYEFNLITKKFYSYPLFKNVVIREIYTDKTGNIWLGSYGDGWYRYSNGRFMVMPLDKLGYLRIVNSIIEDNNGFIWISTNSGIFRFLLKDLQNYSTGKSIPYYNHFHSGYGFESDEMNGGCQPSSVRMKNGALVFPSLEGIVYFHPAKVKLEESEYPVFVDYLRADGNYIPGSDHWKLDAGTEVISIAISSVINGNPYNVQMEYSFVGSDNRWIPIPDDGRIRLVQLQHGRYTLKIRRSKGFGEKGYTYKTIEVTIAPYWYQTRIFYIGIFVTVLLLIFLLVNIRFNILTRQREILRQKVISRTQRISKQNNQLKEKIAEILRNREALKASVLLNDRLMASLAHDIRSPLKFQLKASEILVQFLKGNSNPELVRIATEIESNTAGMYHFTGDILTWHLSVNEKKKFENETINLRQLTQKCIDFLQFSSTFNNNTFLNNIPRNSDVETVPPIIEIIVRNLLDNANKNTRNGTILVSMLKEENACGIQILDNGNGMRQEEVDALNKFYLDEIDASMPGFGSYMLRDFIHSIGAKINYRSADGLGTTVELHCLMTNH